MAELFKRRIGQLYVSKNLTSGENFTGVDVQTFRIQNGSRCVFYLDVSQIVGTLNVKIENSPFQDQNFKELHNQNYTLAGQYPIPLTDIQKFFIITITTSNNTDYKLGITMADGSSSNIAEERLNNIQTQQTDGSQVTNVVSSTLPTGAATEAKQDTQITTLQTIASKSKVTLARIDYTVTPVTTSAYTTLVNSLPNNVTALHIFDSSGRTLVLAIGAAGSEDDQLYIVPGGTDYIPLALPSGSRVSVKAISADATSGELDITFLR